MRNHLQLCVVAALATLLTTFSSCSKKADEVKPLSVMEKLQQDQIIYNVKLLNCDDAELLQVASGQFGSTDPTAVNIEIHLNATGTPITQQSSSALRPVRNMGQQLPLNMVMINDSACVISFIKTNSTFAGNYQQPNMQPSQKLIEKQMLEWHSDEPSGYYTFSSTCLSGVYIVTETTDGFRFTLKDATKTIVMEIERELKE